MLLKILTLATLAAIFIEDIRSRSVHWYLFPLLTIFLISLNLTTGKQPGALWQPALLNLAFLSLQLLLLSAWFSWRRGKRVQLTKGLLGWGDILLLSSLALYFSNLNFVFFYLVSLLIILLYCSIGSLFRGKGFRHIPLAGYQALLLILWLITDWWLLKSGLDDERWLLNFLPAWN